MEWRRDYQELQDQRVQLLVDRTIAYWDNGELVRASTVAAGSVGTAVIRTNAGFRGLEWTVRFSEDVVVNSVPGCYLRPV